MNVAYSLWEDIDGAITSTDLILVTTILTIGAIVGLTTFRDQVVQELGDLAVGVGSLDQSYSVAGATITINGATFVSQGSLFVDTSDDCEQGLFEGNCANEPPGEAAGCIDVCGVAATPE